MSKNKKIILIFSLFIISIGVIVFVLSNTIFYNYKKELSDILVDYYNNENMDKINNINELAHKYRNNSNRISSINSLIEEDCVNRINDYNKEYNSLDELETMHTYLKNKMDYLLNNMSDTYKIKDNKDEYISKIDILYESKKNYKNGINKLNENSNESYEYLAKVDISDIYYNDAKEKLDALYSSEIEKLNDDINKLKTIDENTSSSDKIKVYSDILVYLSKVKDESKINISESNDYKNILSNTQEELLNSYVINVEELASDNKYKEAIEVITNAVNILSKENINTSKLIELNDKYKSMLPISLLDIKTEYNNIIKDELTAMDINNKNYEKSLTFTKTSNKTSSITYDLNKEYVSLTGIVNITKEVSNKKYKYGYIKIYADDKEVYNSKDLTTKFKEKNINIDLKDINKLKIEYTISSSKSINKDNIVVAVLGNPILNKY